MNYQKLFNHMFQEHGLTLTEGQMQDIIHEVNSMQANDGMIVTEFRDDIECPECGEHHVDRDEWAKRLHKKHLCEKCGHVWQPHGHYTFGIKPPQP